MRKFDRKSLTLMEMIMVVVIIGILSVISTVGFRKTFLQSRDREANSLLLLIKHAEDVFRTENNVYTTCADTATCNGVLHLNLPLPATPVWTYSVPNANATTFCALAHTTTPGLGDHSVRQNQDNATSSSCP